MESPQDGTLGFLQILREDYRTHQRDWTLPGFRAVAVYRFGVWVRGLRWRIVRAPLSRLYYVLYHFVRNHYSIELPRVAKIGRRFLVAHQGGIVIHPLAQIGDDCIVRQNVTIGAASPRTADRVPVLGNCVDVGCGAAILGGIRIGDDVRIGANTVVRTDVPDGATVYPPVPQIVITKPPGTTQFT